MDDLVEFLRARLAEDEAVARATAWNASTQIYNAWEAVPPEDEDGDWRIRQKGEVFILTNFDGEEMARHIARHDPARVLREVEAKRRRLDLLAGAIRRGHDDYDLASVLLPLEAAPYADHPAYKPEWSPTA